MTETADKVFRIVNQDLRVLLDKDRTGKYKDDLVIHNAYMKCTPCRRGRGGWACGGRESCGGDFLHG